MCSSQIIHRFRSPSVLIHVIHHNGSQELLNPLGQKQTLPAEFYTYIKLLGWLFHQEYSFTGQGYTAQLQHINLNVILRHPSFSLIKIWKTSSMISNRLWGWGGCWERCWSTPAQTPAPVLGESPDLPSRVSAACWV